MTPRVALIGFGEVGQILGRDLAEQGFDDISAYDRLFLDPISAPSRTAALSSVRVAYDVEEACANRDLVVSAVTAGQAQAVAEAAAPHLKGAIFLDLNSVAPHTRVASQAVIAAAGGCYVEAAVMAPIAPKRLKTPILLGGPHAAAFAPMADRLGLATEVLSDQVGRASAVKLSRSIFVKGLEAIVTESLISARRFGVEAEVLASLENTLPHPDWPGLAHYLITRPLTHGRRRSEEMVEAAAMLGEVGLESSMARATVDLQARQGALGLGAAQDQPQRLADLLDTIAERTTTASQRGKI
jgi:3-hydroxyisobutyrate dehydrogenase-like beta-hydroxyacid dehydrogenase